MMNLDDLIASRAQAYADRLTAGAQRATKEEEILIAPERELGSLQDAAGIKLEGKHEFTVESGFVDSVYDRVLIEYKNPSGPSARLALTLDSPGTKKVVEQIKSRFADMLFERLTKVVAADIGLRPNARSEYDGPARVPPSAQTKPPPTLPGPVGISSKQHFRRGPIPCGKAIGPG